MAEPERIPAHTGEILHAMGRSLLEDLNPQIQIKAAETLAIWGQQQADVALAYLIRAWKTLPNDTVRLAVANAIQSLVDPQTQPSSLSRFSQEETLASTIPSSADILLVTVTKKETQAVLQAAEAITQTPAQPTYKGNLTYYHLGQLGGANTYLVRSEMGSSGLSGSILTISEAIRDLSPQAVIMVGIAFGMDHEKQPIGQVLVSLQIHNYEPQKVGEDTLIPRGDKPPASPRLLNRFRDGEIAWNRSPVKFGLILSGEKLVDNITFRTQLQAQEPEAIGGEMEGAGLYAAALRTKTDWILVKAVCDYADGKKAQNKEENQEVAAKNAAGFVVFVINRGGFVDSRSPSQDVDRRELLEQLNQLLPAQLDQLMILIGIPSSLQPSNRLSPADRVNEVIRWAKSGSGCGLPKLKEALIQI